VRVQDIRVGQVLYWDGSKSWMLQVEDRPDRAVIVRGGYGRYSRAANARDVVPARPHQGRAGIWCWSEAQQWDHIIAAAQLRGHYADIIAGRRGGISLSDDQHYVLQLLADGGTLHQGVNEFQLFHVRHGKIGRVPVRKGTAKVLERHGFIEKSTAPRAFTWADIDWLFTKEAEAWYALNPRKQGVRR
jgi:hypothetical protein